MIPVDSLGDDFPTFPEFVRMLREYEARPIEGLGRDVRILKKRVPLVRYDGEAYLEGKGKVPYSGSYSYTNGDD